ncbi:PAS domain-containing protein [Rhodococcus sp. G-MC3]|uniref:PAS domain-containing protein n=1 Tax=Rhodococcus sp. G-MC3 TaxID=3046209 RepID=UPI0024B9BAFF|nr:PAS domain-containing protein [Rhodococcus sp. G-MC3]MDJ0393444.1 PAS domain-containing protein [Rhodococcus sp. G-MC3]
MTDSNSTGERRNSESRAISDPDQFPDLPVTVVLDRIPVPILAVDPSGGIVFANEAFDELFGTDRSERADFHLHNIFPDQAPEGVNVADMFLTTVATRADSLWRMTDKTGDVVQVRASKSILRRAEDNLVLVALEDFTDQLWNDPKSALR